MEVFEKLSAQELLERLKIADDQRVFVIASALRKAITVDEIHQITKIDRWFLNKLKNIINVEIRLKTEDLTAELLHQAEKIGFTDVEIQELSGEPIEILDTIRRAHDMYPVYKMVDTCAAEFESATPYYYSTYETEDENIISDNEKIVVIGSGPIRIGQGIEFDYCSVHAAWSIQKKGFESIIINNNPETVSTDFDIADKLYFEPLYIEDVYNIIRKEVPKGVIVQFGGQTAINLAPKLLKRGVQILGTSVESINVAEDRKRFEMLLRELGIKQPKGEAVTNLKEALLAANNIGYPVLVRPSYVIGGRAMQIVQNDDDLLTYLKEAVTITPEHPILIDQYILGKELEVDVISDRTDILIPGIMEHLERTGVHSGDSFCVYPHQNVSPAVIEKIIGYSKKLAKALQVLGLMNIQFVVKDEELYVIEVNPRASRTVPIMSKVTQIPMVQIAINVILGEKLKNQGYGIDLAPSTSLIAVKAPVFSFQKLNDVDVALGPEMKSTGEVLGLDTNYELALLKAFMGTGIEFLDKGNILVSLEKSDRPESLSLIKELKSMGFNILATKKNSEFCRLNGIDVEFVDRNNTELIQEKMKNGEINMVMNTASKGKNPERSGFKIRSLAHQYKIPCFTSLDTANAYLVALKAKKHSEGITYETIDYYMNKREVLSLI
jgi:carbamoyl-phosphate synthase large subunit